MVSILTSRVSLGFLEKKKGEGQTDSTLTTLTETGLLWNLWTRLTLDYIGTGATSHMSNLEGNLADSTDNSETGISPL